MAGQIVVGVDVEQLLVDYLAAELPARGLALPVSTKARTVESITLYATGGPGMITPISDQAQITFDVRRTLQHAAADAALLVRAVVLGMAGQVVAGVQVYGVDELARPANLPDPNYDAGNRYRWSVYVHTRASIR